MKEFEGSSYLSGNNSAYLEELYEAYLKNPDQVEARWRTYFESLPKVNGGAAETSHEAVRDYFLKMARQPVKTALVGDAVAALKMERIHQFVQCYRRYGHYAAQLDPLGSRRPEVPELGLSFHHLSRADFNIPSQIDPLTGPDAIPFGQLTEILNSTYCDSIGFQYTYIRNQDEVEWLRQRIERNHGKPKLNEDEKREVLKSLIAADGMERYLDIKYPAQKRFSLEGGDSLIPLFTSIVHRTAAMGVKELVLGMAHRGRLNVLLNVMGLSAEELFMEFEGRKDYGLTSGDVKYHQGFSSDLASPYGPLHVSMMFNPSHLEYVNTIVTGSVRARQEGRGDTTYDQVLPILIHGDAAFSGEGICMETLNMSQTNCYQVGGTIHIVINNQIGFTTSNPHDARSSDYCTDVAKLVDAPILHVNGDDPESVIFCAQIALDFRMKFHRDVVIDLVCYRRHGHNEADEPAATQPLMYDKIHKHPRTWEIYGKQLIAEKVITQDDLDTENKRYQELLDGGKRVVELVMHGLSKEREANWTPYINQEWNVTVDTTVPKDKLMALGKRLVEVPENFELQRQVGMIMQSRAKMAAGEQPIDWGFAENMAYATLLVEGYPVRLSGQDTQRGTFGHRHAVLHDQKTGQTYAPLEHLSPDQAEIHVYNTLLCESGAMGFEYGYALSSPKSLVIWEAQFGDFANVAQVIIDQFISSGWQKWKRLCGLTLLLPHGYEGMGPEHSSARLERYLQLCAQKNMQVCVPTTPAQMFHLLRRQVLRPYRKPLIVMTPKSLLRHKLAISSLNDLAKGKFELVIPEIDDIDPKKVRRVVLCSGKVYYDLLQKRRDNKQDDIAIVRIEQLYPFPYDELRAIMDHYSHVKDVVWCQEEPRNQGAWYSSLHRLVRCLKEQEIRFVGREPSAAPAAGYPALHKKQQEELVNQSLE